MIYNFIYSHEMVIQFILRTHTIPYYIFSIVSFLLILKIPCNVFLLNSFSCLKIPKVFPTFLYIQFHISLSMSVSVSISFAKSKAKETNKKVVSYAPLFISEFVSLDVLLHLLISMEKRLSSLFYDPREAK